MTQISLGSWGQRAVAATVFATATLCSAAALADNPIVQTSYTADPAPMVYDGRLYVYTSHDEDVTMNDFFTMNDWKLYSTLDMVNWTDHGSPASYKTFSWGTGDAWAPHAIHRNGKFYLYVPLNNATGSKIGVAVADSPAGPFTDALGSPLISTGAGNIDPTVFIDSDEQAYLYWGNPDLYYVKLNADMISFAGDPIKVTLTTAGFGVRSKDDRATAYEEGPWFYKRGALYYLVYPADSTPEKLSYSTSEGPLGPWMYRGDIMAKQTGAGASFTNHPGVVDYKGRSFLFYHNGALPGGGGFKRSVCVEELTYGADGSIPTIAMTSSGPDPLESLNPFKQVEAETIAFSSGLKTEACSEGGINVTSVGNGDYIKVKNVDFGSGATSFDARVASSTSGSSIELHLDGQMGTPLATCAVPSTGETWATTTCTVAGATGVHDLFLKFTGGSGELLKLNWWKFSGPGGVEAPDHGGAAGNGSAGEQSTTPGGGSGGGAAGSATAGNGGSPASSGAMSSSSGRSSESTAGNASATGAGPAGASPSCDCQTSRAGGRATSTLFALTLLGILVRRRRGNPRSSGLALPAVAAAAAQPSDRFRRAKPSLRASEAPAST